MSNYQFKVGDKVRYKAEHKGFAKANKHDSEAVYTVNAVDDGLVYFEESDRYSGCFASRLELAEESIPETFDYRQALKILAENPEAGIEYCLNSINWYNVKIDEEWCICEKAIYRLKPQPKKYQWLCKNKDGRYSVTKFAYATKEAAESDYMSHGWKVIKALDETIL